MLGQPVITFGPGIFYSRETWAYGQDFDVARMFHGDSPLIWRWFSPDAKDVVVLFNSSGRVARVSVPSK
jgi:hypothetical protein